MKKNNTIFGFLFMLIVGTPIWASSVTAFCDPPTGGNSFYNPYGPPAGLYAACSGVDSASGTRSNAMTNVNFTLAPTSGAYNDLHIVQSASTQFGIYPGAVTRGYEGSARSAFDFAETVTTDGPLRAGYIEINVTGGGPGYIYSGNFGLKIMLSWDTPTLPPPTLICSGNNGCRIPSFFTSGQLYPYFLGEPVAISGTGDMFVDAGFEEGSSGGITNVNYDFRFFEADGVTPVAVTELPEPGTFALLG